MLLIEPGSELAQLSCRVCRSQLQPGERVLVCYRRGKPSVMHAHVCTAPPAYPADWRAEPEGPARSPAA